MYYWYSHQRINKWTGGLGNKRTSGNHSKCCIIKIGQNTEKSPGDLKRLAVSEKPSAKAGVKNSNSNNNNNSCNNNLTTRTDGKCTTQNLS